VLAGRLQMGGGSWFGFFGEVSPDVSCGWFVGLPLPPLVLGVAGVNSLGATGQVAGAVVVDECEPLGSPDLEPVEAAGDGYRLAEHKIGIGP